MTKRGRHLLVDVYAPDYIRVWLSFDSKSGYELELVSDDSVGLESLPEWYERDVVETGWDSILGLYGRWPENWSRALEWMLGHGIAPDQPFLVHLERPRWYKSGYEYEEWDCEFDWEILRLAPLSPSKVVERIERAVRAERSFREASARREAALRTLRRSDVKAMFLRGEVYFAEGQSHWDDMEMPRGWRYTLCSEAALPKEPRGWACLVSGQDDDGDHKRAMAALVTNAMKELPGLSEETIRKLPLRY